MPASGGSNLGRWLPRRPVCHRYRSSGLTHGGGTDVLQQGLFLPECHTLWRLRWLTLTLSIDLASTVPFPLSHVIELSGPVGQGSTSLLDAQPTSRQPIFRAVFYACLRICIQDTGSLEIARLMMWSNARRPDTDGSRAYYRRNIGIYADCCRRCVWSVWPIHRNYLNTHA